MQMKKNVYTISIASKLIVVLTSFVSSIIINRYLGPDLKGQYTYIINYVGILSLILNLGFGQTYTYFRRKHGEEVKQIFINIYYYQALAYFALFGLVNIFYVDYTLNIVLFTSILAQFNSQVGFMALVFNLNKRNIIAIVSALFYSSLLVIIVVLPDNSLNYILIAYILKLLIDTVLIVVQNTIVPNTIKINKKLLWEMLKYSFFPMVTSLLITLNYSFDIIIMKKFITYDQIGIYSVGATLAAILWVVPDAFKDVLFNKTSKEDSLRDVTFSIKFNIYFSVLVIIVFFIIGKYFIHFFYGIEYLNAYNVTLILFIGNIPMILFKLINTLYISIGKQKFAFFTLLLAVIGNVVANFLLIPLLGIEGSAISSVVSYFVCGLIFLYSFLKKYNLRLREIILIDKWERNKLNSIFVKFRITKNNRH